MSNLYLIVLSEKYNRLEVTKYFDTLPDLFWFYNLPSSIFVKSNRGANEIRELLQKQFGAHPVFVIEVSKEINYSATITEEHIPLFKEYTN